MQPYPPLFWKGISERAEAGAFQYGPPSSSATAAVIKKNGSMTRLLRLKDCGKTVIEDAGVMPNPTVQKLYEGCRLAKENKVDLILAVGGVLYVIMPRLFPFPHTAKATRGKSIICTWRMWTMPLSPWVVC